MISQTQACGADVNYGAVGWMWEREKNQGAPEPAVAHQPLSPAPAPSARGVEDGALVGSLSFLTS